MEAAAGRLMLAEINRLAAQGGGSFAFETVLAGRSCLRRIDRWRRDGYRVWLGLGSPEAVFNCDRTVFEPAPSE